MKKKAAGIVFVVSVLAAPLAFASDNLVGTIKSVDVFARQLVLEDGESYPVLRGINLARFKPGDKVVLEMQDRKGTRTIVRLAKGDRIPIMLPSPTSRSRVP